MPYGVALAILIGSVAFTCVDLSFLYEVVGEVLDLEFWPATAVSVGVGLVGLTFMIHLGYKQASESSHPVGAFNRVVHYSLWIALGLAIAAARFFRATILDLDSFDGETLVEVWGADVAQSDVVFAPIMLIIYLIAGIGAKEATHSVLLNRGFHGAMSERSAARKARQQEKNAAKEQHQARLAETQREMEQKKKELLEQRSAVRQAKTETARKKEELRRQQLEAEQQRAAEAHAEKIAAAKQLEAQRAEAAKAKEAKDAEQQEVSDRRREYYDAVRRYKQLEGNFRKSYQDVSDRLAELEQNFADASVLDHAGNNLLGTIAKSEESTQQQVALLVHSKTRAPVAELRALISAHNATRDLRS
ncbi:hypothetical protein L615_000800000350 [Nocardioides sp. J9]|nr:hypothetical protein L615_000800000350 [Nocardioides sp. J9]